MCRRGNNASHHTTISSVPVAPPEHSAHVGKWQKCPQTDAACRTPLVCARSCYWVYMKNCIAYCRQEAGLFNKAFSNVENKRIFQTVFNCLQYLLNEVVKQYSNAPTAVLCRGWRQRNSQCGDPKPKWHKTLWLFTTNILDAMYQFSSNRIFAITSLNSYQNHINKNKPWSAQTTAKLHTDNP